MSLDDDYDLLDTFEVEMFDDAPVLFCMACGAGVESVDRQSVRVLVDAAIGHRCAGDDVRADDAG